jgi:small subunit ribosomal protein S9
MANDTMYYATGRRKTAIARTWLFPGSGKLTINDQAATEYLPIDSLQTMVLQPFVLTNTVGHYDITIRVLGGGITGQAGAIRHGITKALMIANPELRQVLKKAGFVKRDPRKKERKKYGQRSARARFQFSKR